MQEQEKSFEASFSTLVLSIASTAAMNLGLSPNPVSGKTEKNLGMAKYNIDLLALLKEKTKSNLSEDEGKMLDQVLADLQMQFVQQKNS